MPRSHTNPTVKMSLLGLLEGGSKRYSDLVKELKRPDKTVYVTLKELAALMLVSKNEEGKYAVTKAGREELERMRLVRAVEAEDDPEVIASLTKLHLALTRKMD